MTVRLEPSGGRPNRLARRVRAPWPRARLVRSGSTRRPGASAVVLTTWGVRVQEVLPSVSVWVAGTAADARGVRAGIGGAAAMSVAVELSSPAIRNFPHGFWER
ncbi:hypothetical protein GCM10012284_46360 [Mangrovihabitans endophyticus]|uniref:Uncharacterized protein n=1 Tax=Mangrovihabitans endophyticus TaxID=1751298 RepID=A0A8J3C246_9ACTN|nr:hypothetical protein GCM10012284_46360 [Mangrovihabitans endophyticus]